MEKKHRVKNLLNMIDSSFFKKIGFSKLFGLTFLVTIFFLSSCNSKKQQTMSACLTAEEKTDLEDFLRSLMFENYGAFVLFGSKPLCEMHVSDPDLKKENEAAFCRWKERLPENQKKALEAKLEKLPKKRGKHKRFERNLYRGWLAWEKVRKTFNMNRYILSLTPVFAPGNHDEAIPGSYTLIFANIQQTVGVLAENEEIFKQALGAAFHPLPVVLELQNPDSAFWKSVFSLPNHLAKGLLFGFGLKNSLSGHLHYIPFRTRAPLTSGEQIGKYLKKVSSTFSAFPVKEGTGSPSNFTIPVFSVVEGDDMIEKYTKEKEEIEKIYHGQDLVEVTLQRLAGRL